MTSNSIRHPSRLSTRVILSRWLTEHSCILSHRCCSGARPRRVTSSDGIRHPWLAIANISMLLTALFLCLVTKGENDIAIESI